MKVNLWRVSDMSRDQVPSETFPSRHVATVSPTSPTSPTMPKTFTSRSRTARGTAVVVSDTWRHFAMKRENEQKKAGRSSESLDSYGLCNVALRCVANVGARQDLSSLPRNKHVLKMEKTLTPIHVATSPYIRSFRPRSSSLQEASLHLTRGRHFCSTFTTETIQCHPREVFIYIYITE